MIFLTRTNRLIALDHFAGFTVVETKWADAGNDTHCVQPYTTEETKGNDPQHNPWTALYEGSEIQCHAFVSLLFKAVQTGKNYLHHGKMEKAIGDELENGPFLVRVERLNIKLPDTIPNPAEDDKPF